MLRLVVDLLDISEILSAVQWEYVDIFLVVCFGNIGAYSGNFGYI